MTALIEQIHRFSVDDVLRMVELGALPEDSRVELIEGVLVDMTPQGPEHVWSTHDLKRRLERIFGDRAEVLEAKSVVVGTSSLPEPDLAVVPVEAVDRRRLPRANECLLIVEVALTSQPRDHAKAGLYASASVPVYWLLDLQAGELRVYEEPGPGGYRRLRTYGRGEEVGVPGTEGSVRVSEVLP